MTAPRTARPVGQVDGEPTGIWGASLSTRSTADGLVASCRHCDHTLGVITDGWEAIAGRVQLGADDLGERVEVHDELVTVAYVCPGCVTALWVDTEPVGGKTWTDFALRA